MNGIIKKLIVVYVIALSAQATCHAQNIAINTSGAAANVSAMLDIVASDKGMLLPRVSLTSNTDAATISGTEADALIVFNTNGSMTNGNGKGYYYWDLPTLKWIYLTAASNGPGTSGQVLTSQGDGNNPQWTNASVSSGGGGNTGCAACVTTISTAEQTGLATWITAREYCRTLVEGGYSDWRLPTFEEALYFLSGTFDPPDGSWINDEIWTATAATPVYGTQTAATGATKTSNNQYVWIHETNGTWGYANYNDAINPGCRCVR